MRKYPVTTLGGVLFLLLLSCPRAFGADAASLQLAVAAPDPSYAGETVSFQALAVNTGSENWLAGTYFWEAEIYDLEKHYLAKTERALPPSDAGPGAITSAALIFRIPDGWLGRKFFRVFLVHEGNRIVESSYIPMQIVEKPFLLPAAAREKIEVEAPPEYKASGNAAFLYKNVGGRSEGATTLNIVGKAGASSFLFNAYFLHYQPPKKHSIDPYILVLNYYAPWGVLSLGDISPSFSPLSLYGQGMRGGQLDQKIVRSRWTARWSLVMGRVVPAASGSTGTDGRYERWMYGVKASADLPGRVTVGTDYVLGADNSASLSSDPSNLKYRGPTLRPQRNPLYGLNLAWEPLQGYKLSGDFQQSTISTDTESGVSPLKDNAWRSELQVSKELFLFKAGVQRTGPHFASFGSPTAIPDRMTTDGTLTITPVRWTSLFGTFSQFKDNLRGDPSKSTTRQRTWTAGDSLHFMTGTDLNASYSLNTVQGEPRTALDNRTGTLMLSVSQALKGQTLSANVQNSQFKDKTQKAHDLDTLTMGLRANLRAGDFLTGSLGTTLSDTKDATDGSSRKTNSFSGGAEFPIVQEKLSGQVFGNFSKTTSNAPLQPDGVKNLSGNAEVLWQYRRGLSFTFGIGYDSVKHTDLSSLDRDELTASLRATYSF